MAVPMQGKPPAWSRDYCVGRWDEAGGRPTQHCSLGLFLLSASPTTWIPNILNEAPLRAWTPSPELAPSAQTTC